MPPANELLNQINALSARKGQSFKILIVDDEDWVRELFADICGLSELFEVEMAGGGREAIEKVKAEDFDLITIDLIMPDISGLEAIEAIKTNKPRIPVIAITGNATDRLVEQAGISGACKVLYKPLVLTNFLAELIDTLERQLVEK